MLSLSGDGGGSERRTAERYRCRPETVCRVTDLLDQTESEAGPWNLSAGGLCLVVEPPCHPGTRWGVELCNPVAGLARHVFAEVVYAFELPSGRELYLTGCSFQGETLPDEELEPYV